MTEEFQIVGPDWPDIPNTFAFTVGRLTADGGVVDFRGDSEQAVAARKTLEDAIQPASPIFWFEEQVHGSAVVTLPKDQKVTQGDGVVTFEKNTVCTVRTADCVPVVFAGLRGDRVGVAHAGWRGLQAGIIESVFASLETKPGEVLVWLGPAIGPLSYEVGADVRDALSDYKGEDAFIERENGSYLLDCYQVARNILERLGISPAQVSGGSFDTFTDPAFHSARRDGEHSGRMATLVWFE